MALFKVMNYFFTNFPYISKNADGYAFTGDYKTVRIISIMAFYKWSYFQLSNSYCFFLGKGPAQVANKPRAMVRCFSGNINR